MNVTVTRVTFVIQGLFYAFTVMSLRGGSTSPRAHDGDTEMGNGDSKEKVDAKVVVVTSLTRNVVEGHLRSIFGVYGEIVKVDLPLFGKCTWA